MKVLLHDLQEAKVWPLSRREEDLSFVTLVPSLAAFELEGREKMAKQVNLGFITRH